MIAYPNVKLNLGLHVVRRREDGYHDLETLFVPYLGLHDTLEIITGDDYSRTSARLQETYGAEQLAQGITPDGKLMVTIARKEGVDWDPLKDLTVKAYGLLSEQYSRRRSRRRQRRCRLRTPDDRGNRRARAFRRGARRLRGPARQ